MTEYLDYTFSDSPEFVSTFDELPLWSASFGLLLLKYIDLQPNLTVLDIGSGAGFPLLELAERLGTSCTCFGLDPWVNANNRAKQKTKDYEVRNVRILEGSAEDIPFNRESIDLIVSNLGINNFDNPGKVFRECYRVVKPGGKVVLTTNLNGHWQEFYDIFYTTLEQLGKDDLLSKLIDHQEHRGTIKSITNLFTANGFTVSKHFEEHFTMKFLDGSAFLNHHFIKLGWLSAWKNLISESDQKTVFQQLEENLNKHAVEAGSLALTVPMAYLEGEKHDIHHSQDEL